MVKKKQLKTPPKQAGSLQKIAHNQSLTVFYLTQFQEFLVTFSKQGVFQQNHYWLVQDVVAIGIGLSSLS